MMQPLSHTASDVQVFRVHKNYCTKHCLAGAVEQQEQNPMVMRNMLVEVYGHNPQLPIRRALPFWSLVPYGGVLDDAAYDAWCQTGRCAYVEDVLRDIAPPDVLQAWFDDTMHEAERFRRAYDILKDANRFARFVFDDRDPFWGKPLTAADGLFCWNDGHLIANQIALPVVFKVDEHNRDWCTGLFCSVACKCSYINRHLHGQFKHQRMNDWDGAFNSKYYFAGRALEAQRAASRRLLRLFGGPLTIDEFRSGTSRYRQVRPAEIQKYPVHVIEETPGVWSVSNEKRTWNYLSSQPGWIHNMMHLASDAQIDYLPQLNPVTLSDRDEEVTELGPVYHTVRTEEAMAAAAVTSTRYLLSVDLLTIETDEPIVSNQAILHELIREAQPKSKQRPQLRCDEF